MLNMTRLALVDVHQGGDDALASDLIRSDTKTNMRLARAKKIGIT